MKNSLFVYRKIITLVIVICFPLLFLQCKRDAAEEFKLKGGLRLHIMIDKPDTRDKTIKILFNRIESSGVIFSYEWVKDKDYLLIEIPDVKDPERVLNMLTKNVELEFWETHDLANIFQSILEADELLQSILPETEDSTIDEFEKQHPLLSKLKLATIPGTNQIFPGPVVGYVSKGDMEIVSNYIKMPEIKSLMPFDLIFKWSAKPMNEESELYELYALKKIGRTEDAFGGDIVEKAFVDKNEYETYVSLKMTSEAGRQWQRLTKENVGKNIAIVVNGVVYSAPMVNSEITGGQSMISGNFTREEAKDLADMLNAGIIPAPIKIIHHEMVPPQKK